MGRLLQFRAELMILWRAFLTPETPLTRTTRSDNGSTIDGEWRRL
jgi:hypothetical protein